MLQWFRQVLTSPSFTLRVSAPSPVLPALEGVLWGGNLSVLCTLIGTPWMPRVSGGILFLEDVGEDVYRVERMLLQLLQTGILASQSAILLGRFSASRPDGYDPQGYTLERMIDAFRARLAVPVLTGLPVGHVPDIVPLPIGARARLTSMATGFALTVSGYPVLARLPAAFQAPASGDLTLMKD
jgi:muramoyltetrapeptide carboxypeptidase